MQEMHENVDNVCKGVLPPSPKIVSLLQEIFNFCPDMSAPELSKAFAIKTHESLLVTYMASLTRSIVALHDLINNKLLNRAAERSEEEKRQLLAATRSTGDDEGEEEKEIDPDKIVTSPDE